MLQSKLFFRTLKEPPKDAKTVSHNLLVRGSFIDQLSAGIWNLLPLGYRVFKKIENIVREEMDAISGQEINLPALQAKEFWVKSGRWDKMEPPLFKLKDQHKKEYALGPTHEEVITDLVSRYINSYKQLPLHLYQIQNKFRNEIRVSGGLLRVKEFVMKDLYSFHDSKEDLDKYYLEVLEAYKKIFARSNIDITVVEALSGAIGGDYCHEFMALAPSGEDKILFCESCGFARNLEASKQDECPKCKGKLKQKSGIEAAHVFKLGKTYSEKMGAYFIDKDGQKKPIEMGCYGLGIGRLMATVVEVNHDDNGIIWPEEISPFDVHLLLLSEGKRLSAQKIYNFLKKENLDVLFDDRMVSPSVKLKDSDLIGITKRLIISDKTGDKIEFKERNKERADLITFKQTLGRLKKKNV